MRVHAIDHAPKQLLGERKKDRSSVLVIVVIKNKTLLHYYASIRLNILLKIFIKNFGEEKLLSEELFFESSR